jgi:hypothetical protein
MSEMVDAAVVSKSSSKRVQGPSPDIKTLLKKNNACFVLITCQEPNKEGKMHVEMTYEGDACLAAYLIESAQIFINEP